MADRTEVDHIERVALAGVIANANPSVVRQTRQEAVRLSLKPETAPLNERILSQRIQKAAIIELLESNRRNRV